MNPQIPPRSVRQPDFYAKHTGRVWIAWHRDTPTLKYRGRTSYEALGKAILATICPCLYLVETTGPTGNRQIPTARPDPWADHYLYDTLPGEEGSRKAV